MDKETRKALLAKYLEAETTVDEEARLREWFATHPADEDEREVALLIGLSAPCGHCLPESDEAVEAFDRMMAEAEPMQPRKGSRKGFLWMAGLAAAAVLACLFLLLKPRQEAASVLTPVQIAESIQQMMLLDIGDIESIVANPSGNHALLTVQLTDGRTCTYILSYDGEDGTTSLLACEADELQSLDPSSAAITSLKVQKP